MDLTDIAALAQPTGEKVLLLVLDGVGGLPLDLQAETPHALAPGHQRVLAGWLQDQHAVTEPGFGFDKGPRGGTAHLLVGVEDKDQAVGGAKSQIV